jgi:small-conductance mechanosensitive channel
VSGRPLLALAQGESDAGIWETIKQNFEWQQIAEVAATILIALVVGWIFKRFVLRRFEKLAEKTDTDIDDRLVAFLRRFYKGILLFVVVLVVLRILNIEITPLLAGAGIVGIGVAYASKDLIGNFIAGIVMVVDQPIKVGDRIQIDRIGSQWGGWGDVVDVGLRTTTVQNTDGVHVTYPNAKLSESVIKNFTPTQDPLRFRIRVMVDLETPLQKALTVLVEVARSNPDVLEEPPPSALVRELHHESGGHIHHGALLELRCFVEDIRTRSKLRSALLIAIQTAFGAENIAFARQQLVTAFPATRQP